MTYYYLKTLHHLFVLVWISGLIYTAAVFTIRAKLVSSDKNYLSQTALKFWRYLTWPSMIVGMITGMAMLHLRLFHLADVWMQVKLLAVILLVVFHVRCHILYKRAAKIDTPENEKSSKTWSRLVVIGFTFGVFFFFLMGLKDSFQWVYGTIIATVVTALIGFWWAKKT